MNEMRVECFPETVRFKSYAKAAGKLFLLHPAVSRQGSGCQQFNKKWLKIIRIMLEYMMGRASVSARRFYA